MTHIDPPEHKLQRRTPTICGSPFCGVLLSKRAGNHRHVSPAKRLPGDTPQLPECKMRMTSTVSPAPHPQRKCTVQVHLSSRDYRSTEVYQEAALDLLWLQDALLSVRLPQSWLGSRQATNATSASYITASVLSVVVIHIFEVKSSALRRSLCKKDFTKIKLELRFTINCKIRRKISHCRPRPRSQDSPCEKHQSQRTCPSFAHAKIPLNNRTILPQKNPESGAIILETTQGRSARRLRNCVTKLSIDHPNARVLPLRETRTRGREVPPIPTELSSHQLLPSQYMRILCRYLLHVTTKQGRSP